jgi:hypothetical protein
MSKPLFRCAVVGLVVLVSLFVPNPINRPRAAFAQAPSPPPAELFAVSAQGEVYRFAVSGPQDPGTLDAIFTDPSFNGPGGVTFNAAGEMFIMNAGVGEVREPLGFISRFLHAETTPVSNGVIEGPSFASPAMADFRGNELFVANMFVPGVARFIFDSEGNAIPNGMITEMLDGYARGVAVSPWGELFVSKCCGADVILRYRFDENGNAIFNGSITGDTIWNPHGMAFSPQGELFVTSPRRETIARFLFDAQHEAIPNGVIPREPVAASGIDVDFSPWGELFVSHQAGIGGITRFTFDASGTAVFNGTINTGNEIGGIAFSPLPGDPYVCMPIAFNAAPAVPAPPHPARMAVADFNNDGRTDLVVQSMETEALSVRLGDGAGGFGPATDYYVGPGPNFMLAAHQIAVADLNGDGSLDMAVTLAWANSIGILLGDGHGGFGPMTFYGVGDYPSAVNAADVDGDGDVDLAAGNAGSVSVLLGDGTGNFGMATNYPAGNPDWTTDFMAVGDYNNDGNPDIAVPGLGVCSLFVLLGDGTGDFPITRALNVGTNPGIICPGEFNGDGNLDLATNDGTIRVLLGDGNGGFQPSTPNLLGLSPAQLVVADFDGDGRSDLAVSQAASQNVLILGGNGDGTFARWNYCMVGVAPIGIDAGDFNEDGRPDLAVANYTSANVSILLNAGPCAITAPVLTLPEPIQASATGINGAAVTYTASATNFVGASLSVTCSPESGSTFPLGTTTVTCSATDTRHQTSSGAFTVSVTYSWSGILQPINADGSSVFRRGSTVPVKFRLTGASAGVTDAVARLSYQFVNGSAGTVNEAVSTAQATTGNLFRYDDGQYIFNWSTTGIAVGTYDLFIDLGDGVHRTVRLHLR